MKKILFCSLLVFVLSVGTASAERLSVAVDKGNVRSGPGKNYEVLWSVGKYFPVDIVKTSGDWRKIRDYEGDVGWIHHSLLKEIPAVIVKGSLVNIREGPGTDAKVLFQAESGVSFKVVEKKGKWLRVKHADGDTGWIHDSLIWGD
ncbi:MAG: SH3 domain-containing protein [Deltaproteobacteria bacterium]|nr:SH3 domain-containing protein [Deltaproteobacteria bacterium]